MNHRRHLAGCAIVTALAFPATASAAQHPSTASVRAHVESSGRALARVERSVEKNRGGAAARSLRRALRELRRGARGADRLRRRARGATAFRRAASAERMVGAGADACSEVLAHVVDEGEGPVQLDMAQAISACLKTREYSIESLASMLEVAPEQVRPLIAKAIGSLATDPLDELSALTDALGSAGISPEVAGQLADALRLAVEAIGHNLAALQSIADSVPAQAQGYIDTAVALVTEQLGQAQGAVQQLVSSLVEAGAGAPGAVTLPELRDLLGGLGVRMSAQAGASAEEGASVEASSSVEAGT